MTSAVGASLATAGTALDVPSAGAWAGKAEYGARKDGFTIGTLG